jgi:hypothetical protein
MAYSKGLAGAFPMKGVHTFLNEETLKWLIEALNEVDKAYDDVLHEEEPGQVLLNLNDYVDLTLGKGSAWKPAKDNFGQKMYKALDLGHATELRVTVALKKDDTLGLDIRVWKVA